MSQIERCLVIYHNQIFWSLTLKYTADQLSLALGRRCGFSFREDFFFPLDLLLTREPAPCLASPCSMSGFEPLETRDKASTWLPPPDWPLASSAPEAKPVTPDVNWLCEPERWSRSLRDLALSSFF
jgi:hypothetical protein